MSENTGSAFDKQVGGSYYKQFKIEPYEFFFKNNICHSKAAIIRRILRYDQEGGKGLQDLQKIQHECDLLAELNNYVPKPEQNIGKELTRDLFRFLELLLHRCFQRMSMPNWTSAEREAIADYNEGRTADVLFTTPEGLK